MKAIEGHSPLGSEGLSPGGGVSPVSPESPDVGAFFRDVTGFCTVGTTGCLSRNVLALVLHPSPSWRSWPGLDSAGFCSSLARPPPAHCPACPGPHGTSFSLHVHKGWAGAHMGASGSA